MILHLFSPSKLTPFLFFVPTVEAHVSRGGDEEGLEQVVLCQLVDVPGDVDAPPRHGDRPPEAQQPVEVEGGDLGVVPLKVREVEVVGEGLLRWEGGIGRCGK